MKPPLIASILCLAGSLAIAGQPISPVLRSVWPSADVALPRLFSYSLIDAAIEKDRAVLVNSKGDLNVLDVRGRLEVFFLGALTGANSTTPPLRLVLGDDRVAAIVYPNRLELVDLADPAKPKRLRSISDGADALVIMNGKVFQLVGTQLRIHDSRPSATEKPSAEFSAPWLTAPAAMAGDGRHLYFAGGAQGGFQVLDMKNPAKPSLVGAIQRSPIGTTTDLVLAGKYAYWSGTGGVIVVDLRAPQLPRAYLWRLGASVADLAVGDRRLIEVSGDQTLKVYDLREPTRPELKGQARLPGKPAALGQEVFMISPDKLSRHDLAVFDFRRVSSISMGELIGQAPTVQDMALLDSHVCLAGRRSGLQTVSIAQPARPLRTSVIGGRGAVTAVAAARSKVYYLDSDGAVAKVDLANPFFPGEEARRAVSTDSAAIAVAGSLVLVAERRNGLSIFDGERDGLPPVSRIDLRGWEALDVTSEGPFCHVAAGEGGLRIYQLGYPTEPKLVGVFQATRSVHTVAVRDGIAFLGLSASLVGQDDAVHPGVEIVDVRVPARPRLLARHFVEWNQVVADIALSGDLACLARGGRGLEFLDVSEPSAPRRVAWAKNLPAWRVAVRDGWVYAAGVEGFAVYQLLKKPDLAPPTLVMDDDGRPLWVAPGQEDAWIEVSENLRNWKAWRKLPPPGLSSQWTVDPGAPRQFFRVARY